MDDNSFEAVQKKVFEDVFEKTLDTVYLDNAASSFPKPPEVVRSVYKLLQNNTSNPGRSGHFLSDNAAKIIYNTRVLVSDFFGITGSEEHVIFTQNATHAINIALKGLLKSGDHAIISDMEHNSVLRPLVWLEKYGVCFDIAKVDEDESVTAKNFENLIKASTKLIFITHASNVSGHLLPIEKISALCKKNNIIFCVDASQTAGHIDFDMQTQNIDILCTSGHKGLFGPQGTGLLLINGNLKIDSLIQGGTGNFSLFEEQPDTLPEALESGTLNTVGIVGLNEGIKYISENKVILRKTEKELFDFAYSELEKIKKIEIFSKKENNCGLLAFNVEGYHSDDIATILNENKICVRGGFQCAALFHKKFKTEKHGLVRVSANSFNTQEDIIKLINVLKKC